MQDTIDRAALQRVIAVINGKGGVFKTSLTSNIAGLLAKNGQRVLVVDLDPQGNLAEDFGYRGDARDDEGAALANALFSGTAVPPVSNVRDGLDVYVGGRKLDAAAAALARGGSSSVDAQGALAKVLTQVAHEYDVILLDCPPGEEALQTTAVGAARWTLVPVKSDSASRRGFEAVAERMELVRGQIANKPGINPTVDLLGIVLVDTTTNGTVIQREARARIEGAGDEATGDMFAATVRHSEATAQAARERGALVHELDEIAAEQPAWYSVLKGDSVEVQFAPRTATSVADDLQAVTEELVSRLVSRENEEQQA